MSKYDEDEVSPWVLAYREAFQRVAEKFCGYGVDIAEIPDDLLEQIEREVLEEVGPNPNAGEDE